MDKSFLSLSINLVRFRRRTTSDNKFSLILSNRLLFQMNFPFRVEYLISFNQEEIPSNPCGSSKVKVPPLSTRKKVSPIPKLYFYFFFQKCAHGKCSSGNRSIDRSIPPRAVRISFSSRGKCLDGKKEGKREAKGDPRV